jgi:DNA-binding transcriptional regulator YdaS (Cro superfamily)
MSEIIKSPLERAIDSFDGNQKLLAEAIDPGMSQMNITNWKSRSVPASQFMAIQNATDGAVTILMLRLL